MCTFDKLFQNSIDMSDQPCMWMHCIKRCGPKMSFIFSKNNVSTSDTVQYPFWRHFFTMLLTSGEDMFKCSISYDGIHLMLLCTGRSWQPTNICCESLMTNAAVTKRRWSNYTGATTNWRRRPDYFLSRRLTATSEQETFPQDIFWHSTLM